LTSMVAMKIILLIKVVALVMNWRIAENQNRFCVDTIWNFT
jgi:hypothetical protein